MFAPEGGMSDTPGFFNEHQRRTVEAAMARIIPTDHEPGAREARTVDFIDRYLSGIDYVFAKPDGSGFERLEGKVADAWRQRIDTLRTRYVEGIASLDRRSSYRFGAEFHVLGEEQQDEVLRDLERGAEAEEAAVAAGQAVAGWSPPEPGLQQTLAETEMDFFPMLVFHTRQGFYADPVYGGNRDHVGWKVIGFPGPVSMSEAHSGRFSTLRWFVEGAMEETEERTRGA
jgi:gluconate 2-dehydrogenase gamma chain